MKRLLFRVLFTFHLLMGLATISSADELTIAVAANFTNTTKHLAPLFEKKTGHKLIVSFGSTGQLYAQIIHGAPFDVFLAADDTTPKKLIDAGKAIDSSYMVYASGRLALWSTKAGYVDTEGSVLKSAKFDKIALANPKTAPYGLAAIQALTSLKLLEQLQSKFVMGENIAQTQQFIASGNVPLGFIALAQVHAMSESERGSWWVVPANLHQPIDQGAVILKRDSGPAARAFIDFLKSPEAIAIIQDHGYEVP